MFHFSGFRAEALAFVANRLLWNFRSAEGQWRFRGASIVTSLASRFYVSDPLQWFEVQGTRPPPNYGTRPHLSRRNFPNPPISTFEVLVQITAGM